MADRQRSSYCSKFCAFLWFASFRNPFYVVYGAVVLLPTRLLMAFALRASSMLLPFVFRACSMLLPFVLRTSMLLPLVLPILLRQAKTAEKGRRRYIVYFEVVDVSLQTWRIVGPPGRWNDVVGHISHRTNRPHNGTKLCLPARTQHDQVERPGPKERYRRRDLLVKS